MIIKILIYDQINPSESICDQFVLHTDDLSFL